MPLMPVAECSGVDPQPDGTCGTCGNVVARYSRVTNGSRATRWEHRRGSRPGSEAAKHGAIAASANRRRNIALTVDRVAELEQMLEREQSFHRLDVMGTLGRIEAKLDELLSRPAGVVEWRPDHRRIVDGGVNVRKQRRARDLGRPARPPKIVDAA